MKEQLQKAKDAAAAKELAKTERVEEIARMLSGEMITEEARAASLKLLEN